MVRPDTTGDCTAQDRYCSSIQAAIDAAPNDSIIRVGAGTYTETLDIEDRSGLTIEGTGVEQVLIEPIDTVSWAIPGHPEYDNRRTAVRVVDSTELVIRHIAFDFGQIKANEVFGILYWNSTGTIDNNTLRDLNVDDATGGYHEIAAYLRAPDYTDQQRAQLVVSNNRFEDTGRVGVIAHDFVEVLIEDNEFTKTEDDFGYAIEIGSMATGRISRNTIHGFDTPAASDDSAAGGILVENCFGPQEVSVTKPVTIEENDLFDNQYGVLIGNSWDGLGGDIDIQIELLHNHIHDNWGGGVNVCDEDRQLGSSVQLSSCGNLVQDNQGVGYFFFTLGDGEIDATLAGDIITGNGLGAAVELYDDEEVGNSSFNIVFHHNAFVDNQEQQGLHSNIARGVYQRNNWWGCNAGPVDGVEECDLILGEIESGNHLVLALEASPSTVTVGETATVEVDLRLDCQGHDTSALGCVSCDIAVQLATDLGLFGSSSTTQVKPESGVAQATLSVGDTAGIATVSATLDHQQVSTQVTVTSP